MTNRERGSSIVEFAILGTLIFGVLVQAIVLFGVLHRATLATSAAAREYGRAIVVADSSDEARLRGALVVEQAARNHGLPHGSLVATVEGLRARGELLRVRVRTEVPIFRIPFLGDVWSSVSVPVEATHVVQVDRYRSGP
ncbi:MAG: TadE/TadG family type IV pilus assembly protein [Acidimicrobiia bacterium]